MPSRSDWHAIRAFWATLDPATRPPSWTAMGELFLDPEEARRLEAAEPFPRFTKETAARARAAAARAHLKVNGVEFIEE